MRRAAVVMTAHNTAAYIGEAVASVRASMARVEGWALELRIGVDACHDTADALDRLGEPYHWSAARVGTFVLRNSLMGLSSADAFAGFDSDDVMLPDYLSRLLAIVNDANIVGAARQEVGAQLEPETPPRVKRWQGRDGTCVFSRGALAMLGGYWTKHQAGMDSEIMDRATHAGIPWAAVDVPLFLRRRNPASLTRTPETGFGSPVRDAAIAAIKERRADRSLVHIEPVTAPLLPHRPVQRVAVLVTAYRAAAWLSECLQSVRTSMARVSEAIDVDLRVGVDGCPETAALLDRMAEPYYMSRENVGTYVLRNSLAALAPADAYIVFDSDDVMRPQFLPVMVAALQSSPYVGPGRHDCDLRLKGGQPMKYVSGVCGLRRDLWLRLGGYRAERYSADTDLCERSKMLGIYPDAAVMRTFLYWRRRHPASLTLAPGTHATSKVRLDAQQRMERQRLGPDGWKNDMVTVPLVTVRAVEVSA